jgi:hypothetical protein
MCGQLHGRVREVGRLEAERARLLPDVDYGVTGVLGPARQRPEFGAMGY